MQKKLVCPPKAEETRDEENAEAMKQTHKLTTEQLLSVCGEECTGCGKGCGMRCEFENDLTIGELFGQKR